MRGGGTLLGQVRHGRVGDGRTQDVVRKIDIRVGRVLLLRNVYVSRGRHLERGACQLVATLVCSWAGGTDLDLLGKESMVS